MLLSDPFGELYNIFQDEFNKILSRMSVSFYHITESSELNWKKTLISPRRSAMFWNFCVGIHRYSALNYDVIKSYLTRVWEKKIRNGYIALETRVVMW